MTHQTILLAHKDLKKTQSEFYNLSCELYLRLLNTMTIEMQMPAGSIVKYDNYNKHSNIIDNCILINKGIATLKIGLLIEEAQHLITFELRKERIGHFIIGVNIDESKFEFKIGVNDIMTSNFAPIFKFITEKIVEQYKNEKGLYQVL